MHVKQLHLKIINVKAIVKANKNLSIVKCDIHKIQNNDFLSFSQILIYVKELCKILHLSVFIK